MWGLPLFDVLDIINKFFWWISKTVLDIFAFQGSSLPWGIFPDTDAQLSVLDWSSPIHNFHIFGPVPKNSKGNFHTFRTVLLKVECGTFCPALTPSYLFLIDALLPVPPPPTVQPSPRTNRGKCTNKSVYDWNVIHSFLMAHFKSQSGGNHLRIACR